MVGLWWIHNSTFNNNAVILWREVFRTYLQNQMQQKVWNCSNGWSPYLYISAIHHWIPWTWTCLNEIWSYWFGNWKNVYFRKYACIIHQLIAIFVLLQDKFKFKYISPEERLEEENKANKKKVDKRSFCYTNNQGN